MKFTPAVGVVVSWANLSFSVSPGAGEDLDWKSGGVCGVRGEARNVVVVVVVVGVSGLGGPQGYMSRERVSGE